MPRKGRSAGGRKPSARKRSASGRQGRTQRGRGSAIPGGQKTIVLGSIAAGVALVAVLVVAVLAGAGSASDFEFNVYQREESLGGDRVNFSDLLGNGTPVVLNFWGGDCPPCRAEMPGFQKVYEAHQDEFLLVGVDVGRFMGLGSQSSALALLAELNITYPTGEARSRTPLVNYAINSLPSTIFFRADGGVFRKWDGTISEERMNLLIEDLLEES